MNGSPLFSVLVPVYNVAPYLRACVDSVLGQSCQDFELILVDDGSTDESGVLCDAFAAEDMRIRVFHKENGGQLSARCHAVAHAAGEYFVFLDSDDTLVPHALETLKGAIGETGADCLLYGIRWDRPGGTEHLLCPPALCGRLITDRRAVLNVVLNDGSFNSLCRKCARSSCFDGRDLTPYYSIRSGEDLIQSTEILENAQSFLFLPDELYLYRVNDASVTHSRSFDDYDAAFTVERFVQSWLEKLAVFRPEDYDRLRNHRLDSLVIDIKRICRFCSSREASLAALRRIPESAYYRDFLHVGYRGEGGGLRRVMNRIAIGLLHRGRFGALYLFCTRIYSAG